MNKRARNKTPNHSRIAAFCIAFGLMVLLVSGCGGGGGGRSAASVSGNGDIGLNNPGRTGGRLTNRTQYKPSLSGWNLYKGTAGEDWISAVGSIAGTSASVSAPCNEIGVMFMPKGNSYNNGATVKFYLDGKPSGTLAFSGDKPWSTYEPGRVNYYQVAKNLDPAKYHTLTIEIVSGAIAFDGWQFTYQEQIYRVDASDSNTVEAGALTELSQVRDAVEAYFEDHKVYPEPASGTSLIDFLYATGPYFSKYPKNTFTRNNMTATSTVSAGDYQYTRTSSTDYTLIGYGARGTLVTFGPNKAETEALKINLTSPTNHQTTASASLAFAGTITNGVQVTVCCGASGMFQFPSTGSISQDVILKEGSNSIRITLNDSSGNTIYIVRTVKRDNTAPDIKLLDPFPLHGPANAMWVDVYAATTTVRVFAEIGSTVSIASAPVVVDTFGVASSTVNLIPGNNIIRVTATDLWNNTSNKDFTIKYNLP